MLCDLVRVTTEDGVRLDGALFAPPTGTASALNLSAIVCLHGVASNFYGSSLFENLLAGWQSLGLTVLIANTRGHDTVFASNTITGRRFFGAAFECVDESRLDVAAWCNLLSQRGHHRIALGGHSLGAIKTVYCGAQQLPTNVAALIALSPPRLSYSAFMNGFDSASFFQAMSTAKEHVENSRGDTLMKVGVPFPMMMSAAGYVEKYGPEERYNILKYIHLLRLPTLFSYGGQELEQGGIAFAGMPDAIQGLARDEQSLSVITIPNADHNYTKTHEPLGRSISDWLRQNFAAR